MDSPLEFDDQFDKQFKKEFKLYKKRLRPQGRSAQYFTRKEAQYRAELERINQERGKRIAYEQIAELLGNIQKPKTPKPPIHTWA